MYDAEFLPAVRALDTAAQRFLGGETGAASALDLAVRRHLHVIQRFDKLKTGDHELRMRLIRYCNVWMGFSSIRPSEGATRHQIAEEICTSAKSFADRYA